MLSLVLVNALPSQGGARWGESAKMASHALASKPAACCSVQDL
jgi:hypothetical protein